MKSKIFVILLVLLLIIPLALAIDCNDLDNKQWCQDIQNSDLSEEEKAYLLSDIISDSKHYPDHNLVKQWNEKVSTTEPVEGITKKNKGYIRNSWVKILTVMPSVLLNDELLISNEGDVLTGFNHDVQIPSGTASGDCKTRRYLLQNTGTLKLYLDDQYQGSDHYTTSLPDNTDVNIIAKYTAKARTKIYHYTWQKKYYWSFGEKKYRWVCKYNNIEYKTDKLVVKDSIKAKIHHPQLSASFKVKDKLKGEFNSDNVVNTELSFFDSYYKEHNYIFSEVFTLPNVLTVKAEKQLSKEHHNLAYSGGEIVVPKLDGCKIKVSDFFRSELIPCDLNYENTEFTISTDKRVYAENDTINLEIKPAREYKVTYAGEEYLTQRELELKAEYPHNRIVVKYKEKVIFKLIHVKNDQPLTMAFTLIVFGMVNYTLVGLIRKYWGVLID